MHEVVDAPVEEPTVGGAEAGAVALVCCWRVGALLRTSAACLQKPRKNQHVHFDRGNLVSYENGGNTEVLHGRGSIFTPSQDRVFIVLLGSP